VAAVGVALGVGVAVGVGDGVGVGEEPPNCGGSWFSGLRLEPLLQPLAIIAPTTRATATNPGRCFIFI